MTEPFEQALFRHGALDRFSSYHEFFPPYTDFQIRKTDDSATLNDIVGQRRMGVNSPPKEGLLGLCGVFDYISGRDDGMRSSVGIDMARLFESTGTDRSTTMWERNYK